VALFLWLKFT